MLLHILWEFLNTTIIYFKKILNTIIIYFMKFFNTIIMYFYRKILIPFTYFYENNSRKLSLMLIIQTVKFFGDSLSFCLNKIPLSCFYIKLMSFKRKWRKSWIVKWSHSEYFEIQRYNALKWVFAIYNKT